MNNEGGRKNGRGRSQMMSNIYPPTKNKELNLQLLDLHS